MAGKIIKAILKAEDRATPTISRVGTAIKTLGVIAVGVGTIALGRELVRGIKAAVAASAIQEAQERKLQAALVSTGQFSKELFERLKDQAAGLQAVTDIGDETTIQMQALLLQFGAAPELVTRFAEATADMAKTLGQDYNAAAIVVSKAIAGNVRSLFRYGVEIDQAAFKTRGAITVLEGLESVFGGRSRAEANTFTGALEQMSNAVGDLQETLGDPFREVFTVAMRSGITPFVEELTKAAEQGELFRQTIIELAIASATAGKAVEPAVEALTKLAFIAGSVPATVLVGGLQAISAAMDKISGERESGRFDELIADLEKLRKTKIEGFGAIDPAGFVGPLTAVEQLNAALKEIKVAPLRDLATEGRAVADAFSLLIDAQGEMTPEQFDKIADALAKAADSVTGEGGIVPNMETLAVKSEETFLRIDDATNMWIDGGLSRVRDALREMKADGLEPIGQDIQRIFRGAGISAAVSFGDALVNAAITGRLELKKLFAALLQDLARALVQALILRAALTFFPGLSGGGIAGSAPVYAKGGIVKAQHGLLTGGTPGRDSIPVLAMPGEAFLPKNLTDLLLNAARSAGPAGVRDNRDAETQVPGIVIERLEIRALDAPSFRRLAEQNPEGFAAGVRMAIKTGAL